MMKNTDYTKIERPDKHPAEKYKTIDGFVNWFDQRTWGTKKGSLGMSKETEGKIMGFEDFIISSGKLKGK